jgi:hypothetical protein
MEAFLLPEVEVAVALVVAVHDPGLAGRQELEDQGAFIAFAVGQTEFSGDAPVDVKAQMNLGLFAAGGVIGPSHGADGVDEASVNGHQIAQLGMDLGQGGGGLSLKFFIDKEQLFQASGVEGLAIAAPANAFGRGDEGTGEIVLLHDLEQVPGGVVLF